MPLQGIRDHHPELWEAHRDHVAVLHYTDAKPWQPGHPGKRGAPRQARGASQPLPRNLLGGSRSGQGEGLGRSQSGTKGAVRRHPMAVRRQTPALVPCAVPPSRLQSMSGTETWLPSGGLCTSGGFRRLHARRRHCCRRFDREFGLQLPASRQLARLLERHAAGYSRSWGFQVCAAGWSMNARQ